MVYITKLDVLKILILFVKNYKYYCDFILILLDRYEYKYIIFIFIQNKTCFIL